MCHEATSEEIRLSFVNNGCYIKPGLITSEKWVPGTIEFGYMFDDGEVFPQSFRESFRHSCIGRLLNAIQRKNQH